MLKLSGIGRHWRAAAAIAAVAACLLSERQIVAQGVPQGQTEPISSPRLFAADGAIILNFIKPDKVADFELVIAKLKEALAKSDKPERKSQATAWKVFRSPDPAGDNVLFVFVIDPAVKGADYQVSNLIAEAFTPTEANDILTKYAGAYAQGMNIVNLNLVEALGN